MSKGIFIGDPHFQGISISSRKDIFLDSIITKFIESLNSAKDQNVDYIVILGDVFSAPEPSGKIRNLILNLLLRGNNGKEWPFEMYTLIGNHDIIGHTINSINRTAIQTLITAEALKMVDESNKYGIYFGHFDHYFKEKTIKSKMPIWALHANILPQQFYDDYVLIEDFQVQPETKIVISGHYHPGYDIITRDDGVIFANPGSLARVSSHDIRDNVQIALIENNNENITIEYQPITSAKKADMVFDLGKIKQVKEKSVDVKDFISVVNKAQSIINEEKNVITLVKKFAGDIKIENKIINEAIKRIEYAQNNMEDNEEDE